MKLTNIIGTIAVSALALVSCAKEQPISSINGFEISSSYVNIAQAGGTAKIEIKKTDYEWSIDTTGKKATWLTVDPVAGKEPKSISFTAAENKSGAQKVELKMYLKNGADTVATQLITVAQAGQAAKASTVKEVLEGSDGVTYKITATVMKITSKHYGEMYINDGTSEADLFVYNVLDKKGNKMSSSTGYDVLDPSTSEKAWDISVGDVITIVAPRSTYNGTIELTETEILSITKSLLDVAPEELTIVKEGGNVDVVVKCKGNDLAVVPQEDWISLSGINVGADSTIVTLAIKENTNDPRTGTVIIKSSIPGQSSEKVITITQNGVAGTLKVPFTVAQACQFCSTLTGATPEDYYVKGIVTKVLYTYSADFGTATFWISDDGKDSVSEDKKSTSSPTTDFECYGVYWLGNTPWTEGEANVSAGDEVLICGKLTKYGATCETSSKKAYVYAINGLTQAGCGAGSEDYPFTCVGAVKAMNADPLLIDTEKEYCVKGKVTKILNTFNANYGNGTFWMSDDGNDSVSEDKKSTTSPTTDFECYNVYWYNNAKWVEGNGQVAAGDEVVVKGKLTLYKGITETSSKLAWIYSINGKKAE